MKEEVDGILTMSRSSLEKLQKKKVYFELYKGDVILMKQVGYNKVLNFRIIPNSSFFCLL